MRASGTLYAVEFDDGDDDRPAGTYVTIRVDGSHAWSPGRVTIQSDAIQPANTREPVGGEK